MTEENLSVKELYQAGDQRCDADAQQAYNH